MGKGAWQATVHGITKELDMTDRLTHTHTRISGILATDLKQKHKPTPESFIQDKLGSPYASSIFSQPSLSHSSETCPCRSFPGRLFTETEVSHKINRAWETSTKHEFDCVARLLLGKKVMTNLDRVLKRRDITVPTKDRLVKAVVFPVVMYGCESWTVRKAEHQKIDAFELWG